MSSTGPRPHGGRLVSRVLRPEKRDERLREAGELPRLALDVERARDVKCIARGVYSPLTGFLGREDVERVLAESRLASDVPWTIPIVLDVASSSAPAFSEGDRIALADPTGAIVATMDVEEVAAWDRESYAIRVFGTNDPKHPGVAKAREMGDRLVAGPIELLDGRKAAFADVNLDPHETRVLFKERGWRTVAGYQTRNPPHRAHEAVQKTALAFVDGLFVNPVVGRKKPGDFRDEVIVDAYRAMISSYFPRDRVAMSVLTYEMRYAGPKEAILHAIMRKNFGCTHFIVGRDHAGVGKFYRPEAAIEAFAEFPDLGIEPIAVRGDHNWCRVCLGLETERTCPHGADAKILVSGTLIRELLSSGRDAPPEILRPEVLAAIAKHPRPFVE